MKSKLKILHPRNASAWIIIPRTSARMVWRPDTPATGCVVRCINGVGTLLPTNVEFSTPTVTPLRLNAHCNPAASRHQLSGECVLNAISKKRIASGRWGYLPCPPQCRHVREDCIIAESEYRYEGFFA